MVPEIVTQMVPQPHLALFLSETHFGRRSASLGSQLGAQLGAPRGAPLERTILEHDNGAPMAPPRAAQI